MNSDRINDVWVCGTPVVHSKIILWLDSEKRLECLFISRVESMKCGESFNVNKNSLIIDNFDGEINIALLCKKSKRNDTRKKSKWNSKIWRIFVAKKYLSNSEMTILRIFDKCDYSSPVWFEITVQSTRNRIWCIPTGRRWRKIHCRIRIVIFQSLHNLVGSRRGLKMFRRTTK